MVFKIFRTSQQPRDELAGLFELNILILGHNTLMEVVMKRLTRAPPPLAVRHQP